MGMLDYIRSVPTASCEEVRHMIETQGGDTVVLVDVRLPQEYHEGHIPGARHIPLDELALRADALPKAAPVITYCTAGVRSRAAASILLRAGFERVHSMRGGIRAWNGLVAEGSVEAESTYFAGANTLAEYVALAWRLEKNSERFYREMAETIGETEGDGIFETLADDELHHSGMLGDAVAAGDSDGTKRVLEEAGPDGADLMEGGMPLSDALQWAHGRELREVLQFAMALEANANDLYLHMVQAASGKSHREVFARLADGEKTHLKQLSAALAERL